MGYYMEVELVKTFLALTQSGKVDVLACIAHWETVWAREAYLQRDGPIDGQLLRRSNEYIHRLTGYIVAVLSGHTTPDDDACFMRMVIEVTAQRGYQELEPLAARLRQALAVHSATSAN